MTLNSRRRRGGPRKKALEEGRVTVAIVAVEKKRVKERGGRREREKRGGGARGRERNGGQRETRRGGPMMATMVMVSGCIPVKPFSARPASVTVKPRPLRPCSISRRPILRDIALPPRLDRSLPRIDARPNSSQTDLSPSRLIESLVGIRVIIIDNFV